MPNIKNFSSKLSNYLEVPEDALGNTFRLQIIGECAILCGCHKLVKYKSQEITALTSNGCVTVCGEHLKCVYFFEKTLEISGKISCVRMENQ